MTTWILIIIMNVKGSFMVPIEFNSKERCEAGFAAIKATSNTWIEGVCVEK